MACQGLEALVNDGDLVLKAPREDLATAIAEATDGLPYYINYCVDRLTELQGPVELRHVPEAIDSLIPYHEGGRARCRVVSRLACAPSPRFYRRQESPSVDEDVDLAEGLEGLKQLPLGQAQSAAERLLLRFVGDRQLLLITENLEEIFDGTKGIGREGQQRFRELSPK